MWSGGHKGLVIRQRPRRYSRTPQQQKFSDALKFCGIEKGITKPELMDKMKNCLPKYFQEHKEEE